MLLYALRSGRRSRRFTDEDLVLITEATPGGPGNRGFDAAKCRIAIAALQHVVSVRYDLRRRRRYLSTSLGFAFPAHARRKSSRATLAVTDQLHTSTLRPGTLEKCLILFVTSVIPWDTACDAISRSMFPIGLPARSNSVRIRA